MAVKDLTARAQNWLDIDPDPETQSLLKEIIQGGSEAELAALFSGQLGFGTAGIRGQLGPGPMRMNRVLVQAATRALVGTLKAGALVIVGYDARKNSNIFAYDAAGVVNELGGTALVIDQPLPTPVLARAVIARSADAGIMVTASHNPKDDNGYKVYWSDGAQIAPPHDSLVEHALKKIMAGELSASDYLPPTNDISGEALQEYIACLTGQLRSPEAPLKDLKIVYTPMHGVGGAALSQVFEALSLAEPVFVPLQADPDPSFPTADFPNPEEAGALDLAFDLARSENADLILANDPDADRLAVALPTPDGWQSLTGNELGILLADYCLSQIQQPEQATLAATCVSSQMLSRLCAEAGAKYVETLTGFKWISRADFEGDEPGSSLIFGYEEALGYAVLPQSIRDKDGISAAAVFVNLFSKLKTQGKSPLDRLDELYALHGLHITSAVSVRFDDSASSKQPPAAVLMGKLRSKLPKEIGGQAVQKVIDYTDGSKQRPTNMVSFFLEGGGSRVVVRPSGTEPKLKIYVELVRPASGGAGFSASQKSEAQTELAELTQAAGQMIIDLGVAN